MPIKEPNHTKALAVKYFGKGSSAAAAELKRVDPILYDQIRVSAEAYGLVGPRSYFRPQDNPLDHKQVPLTPEQIKARALYDQDYCNHLFRDKSIGLEKNAATLAKNDPEAYRLAKISAVSYGILPESTSIPPRTPPTQVPPADTSVAIGANLAKTLGLAPDHRAANYDELQGLIRAAADVADVRAAREAVAAAKEAAAAQSAVDPEAA